MKTYDIALLFMLCIFSVCDFTNSTHDLKEYDIRNLCKNTNATKLDIRYMISGILKATFYKTDDPVDCKLTISPKPGSLVVLSDLRYQLDTTEHVSITDSDNVMIVLRGERYFYDEKKSFTSNGPMTIHVVINSSYPYFSLEKLRFVFTEVHDSPCHDLEFQCRNLNCIPSWLKCNSHNHCGDNSDNADDVCYPITSTEQPLTIKTSTEQPLTIKTSTEQPLTIKTMKPVIIREIRKTSIVPIVIAAAAMVLVLIIVIPLTVYGVRKMKRNSKPHAYVPGTIAQAPTAPPPQIPSASISQLPTVLVIQQDPTAPAQMQAGPSVFFRMRQSFRRSKSPSQPPAASADTKKMDNYQVPSMYPQIPDVSGQEGLDNPEFKIEE